MKKNLFYLPSAFCFLFIFSFPLYSEGESHPASHAPIGVMRDHLHHANSWMLSYRYMRMNMESSYIDTEEASIREEILYKRWEEIEGADERLATEAPEPVRSMLERPDAKSIQTAQPELQAGSQINIFLGMSLYTEKGPGRNHRLAVEHGVPLLRDVEGPQLTTDSILVVGWQSAL